MKALSPNVYLIWYTLPAKKNERFGKMRKVQQWLGGLSVGHFITDGLWHRTDETFPLWGECPGEIYHNCTARYVRADLANTNIGYMIKFEFQINTKQFFTITMCHAIFGTYLYQKEYLVFVWKSNLSRKTGYFTRWMLQLFPLAMLQPRILSPSQGVREVK